MPDLPRLFAKRRIGAEPRQDETSVPAADPKGCLPVDRMPTREQVQAELADAAIHITAVYISPPDPHVPDRWAWTWRCDCHPGTECAVPWAKKPAMESAVAEHDLVVAERTVGASGRWLR